MIIGTKFPQELQGVGQFLLDEVEQIVASIKGYWDANHDDDGNHKFVIERGRTVPMGEWTPIQILDVNFTPGGGLTFTATQGSCYYMLMGLTIFFRYRFTGTLGGVLNSNFINMLLPFNVKVPLLAPTFTTQMPQTQQNAESLAGTRYIGEAGLLGVNTGVAQSQLQFTHEKGGIFAAPGSLTFEGGLMAQITEIINIKT